MKVFYSGLKLITSVEKTVDQSVVIFLLILLLYHL